MKKHTKTIIAIALLTLIMVGLWFYWEQELVLGDIIPDGDMRVQFYIVTPGVGATDIQLDDQIESLMLEAVRSDGTSVPVIRDGLFVLPGTDILNEPFQGR